MNRAQLSLISLNADTGNATDERRRPGRIACERLRCGSGRVVDLSRTGAKLQIHSLFAPREGSHRSLTLQTVMGTSSPLPCTIMWVKQTGLMQFEIGAQFHELNPEQQRLLAEIAKIHSKRTVLNDVA